MHGESQQTFFVVLSPILHSVADIHEQHRLFGPRIVWKYKNRTALSGHKVAVAAIACMSQDHRSKSCKASVLIRALEALPAHFGKRDNALQRQLAIQRIGNAAVRCEDSQFDVSIGHGIVMILQADVPLVCLAELRKRRKFARSDSLVPLVVALIKVVVADSVDCDFTLPRRDAEVEMIPFAGRASCIIDVGAFKADLVFKLSGPRWFHRFVKLIQPARFLRVMAILIVLNLNFRAAVPGLCCVFGHMKHDSAVAAFGDAVFQSQFEVLVLFICNNVARAVAETFHRLVFYDPAVADPVGLIVAPSVGRFAVEQQLPATTFFGFGQTAARIISLALSFGKQ